MMTEFLIIGFCLTLNAVLSCIEMAFVTASKAHVKQLASKGSIAAHRLLKLKKNPERVLSVLQIGITLVGAVSAAVGGASAEESLSPTIMSYFSVTENTAEYISIALIVVPLTYISVVIGELVPKTLALRYPMKFALSGGWILVLLDRVFAPFVFSLEISTKFITQIFLNRLKPEPTTDDIPPEVDIAPLSDSHKQYVFNLIDIDKRSVKDIMIPWDQVSTIEFSEHYFDVLNKIKQSRHTRLPVIQGDRVVGLLHTKEFVSETEISKIKWTELIRPTVNLHPKERILTALRALQSKKSHMALVISEGKPIGIVTMEDIFEEVVGEIYDEDDDMQTLLSSTARIRTWTHK